MSERYYIREEAGDISIVKAASGTGGTLQVLPDKFEEHYDKLGLVRPPLDVDTLSTLVEIDTWHRRSILQKASDSTGLGWSIVKDPYFSSEPNPADRDRLVEFFSNANPDMPFEDLLEAFWIDYDGIGSGALEVVTDGTNAPVEIWHVPFKTVRVHRTQKIYAQVRGVSGDRYKTLQWFVDYGLDQQGLNQVLERAGQDAIDAAKSYRTPFNIDTAGDLIVLKSYSDRSTFYGVPESISAIGAMSANQTINDYNIGRLASRGVPDYIMTLSDAELNDETRGQIKDFLNRTKKKSLTDGPKIMAFEVGQGKATFEKITPDSEDANWLQYRKDNRDEILAAHGMPKYRLGISESSSLGQSLAEEQSRIYSMSIVRHRRKRMEHFLTQKIIRKGFGILGWKIEFEEMDIRNEVEEARVDAASSGKMGWKTINEIRKARKIGPPLPGGDRVVWPVGQALVTVAGDFTEPGSSSDGVGGVSPGVGGAGSIPTPAPAAPGPSPAPAAPVNPTAET